MTEKQYLIDIWEGDTDLDHSTLISNGVKGMIFRINSISGGNHLDDNFLINYEASKKYLVNGIYYVYNPWVKGKPNLDWLLTNIPKDFNGRLFIDIEVAYNGYAPLAYANEISYLFTELSKKYRVTPYTGAGYLQLLSYWPKNEYWWANYQYSLYPSSVTNSTWENVKNIVETNYQNIPQSIINMCPSKNIGIWQITGDRLILEGMNKHAVDINLFYGSEEDLVKYFGGSNSDSNVDPVENPVIDNEYLTYIVVTDTLNVRSKPLIGNNWVGALTKNTKIKIKNINPRNDVWLQIDDSDQFGGNWISLQYNDVLNLEKK
jgi:hypothetical protein